jgi:hypothetical protein
LRIDDAQAEDYGREAVTSKVWDWQEGMVDGAGLRWVCPEQSWPDLRHPGTFALAYFLWQCRPDHCYTVPCPVLTWAAAYGISSRQAIKALVAELKKV